MKERKNKRTKERKNKRIKERKNKRMKERMKSINIFYMQNISKVYKKLEI